MNGPDSRKAPRKIIRRHAVVLLASGRTLSGRTVDVSLQGLAIMLEEALPIGEACAIKFDAPAGGALRPFQALATVIYSICSGTAGFRTGLRFKLLDEKNIAIIDSLP